MANTTFYQKLGDQKKSVSWADILSESFKKHDQMDRDRLFAVGTAAWKVTDGNMLSKWRKPWLWTRLLRVFLIAAVLIIAGMKFFSEQMIFYVLAMVLMPIMLPLVELVLLWELNIPQNLSLWDVLQVFLVGGILSLLISIAGFSILGNMDPKFTLAQYAPLAEEPGKLIAILVFISRFKKRNNGKMYGITGLVIGAAVGAGFSAFESIMYAMNGFGDLGMGIILVRMLSALCGHIQFAAPYAAALVYGSAEGKRSGVFTGRFLLAFAVGCLLHGLWNGLATGIWMILVLTVVAWSILLSWVNKCMKEAFAAGTSPAAAMPVIRWLYGPFAGQNMTVTTGHSMHIGRAPGNQVVFPQDTSGVSREHCVLRADSGLTIEDCGSSVGTFVDGKKLAPHTPSRLVSGQKVALGSSKNSFEVM